MYVYVNEIEIHLQIHEGFYKFSTVERVLHFINFEPKLVKRKFILMVKTVFVYSKMMFCIHLQHLYSTTIKINGL